MRLLPRLVAVVLALTAAACVPPPPDNDEFVRFDEETVMGEIQAAGTIVVGIPDDAGQPWVDFVTPLANDISGSLGVSLEIESHPNDELVALVDDGELDAAFPVVTLTEELVRKHAFSDPIYVAHQRLVVPADAGVETVEDLDGVVGSPIDDATGVELPDLNEGLLTVPLKPGDAAGCAPLFEQDLVTAATAPDVLLAALLAELGPGYEVAGEQLTTEPLGVSLERGASAWVDYVNGIITEFDDEGRWAHAYEESLGELLGGEPPDPPNMTVEEAAALFPSELAES